MTQSFKNSVFCCYKGKLVNKLVYLFAWQTLSIWLTCIRWRISTLFRRIGRWSVIGGRSGSNRAIVRFPTWNPSDGWCTEWAWQVRVWDWAVLWSTIAKTGRPWMGVQFPVDSTWGFYRTPKHLARVGAWITSRVGPIFSECPWSKTRVFFYWLGSLSRSVVYLGLRVGEWRDAEMLHNLCKFLNSAQHFEMNDTFTLNFVQVQVGERGTIRHIKLKLGHLSHDRLRERNTTAVDVCSWRWVTLYYAKRVFVNSVDCPDTQILF